MRLRIITSFNKLFGGLLQLINIKLSKVATGGATEWQFFFVESHDVENEYK